MKTSLSTCLVAPPLIETMQERKKRDWACLTGFASRLRPVPFFSFLHRLNQGGCNYALFSIDFVRSENHLFMMLECRESRLHSQAPHLQCCSLSSTTILWMRWKKQQQQQQQQLRSAYKPPENEEPTHSRKFCANYTR